MSPKASHKVRPGLSSAASLMTTLLISFDQEVLNQHLNLVTPEYPFFESPWVPFTALLTMNLLEVSHKPEHTGFFLSSALTWLRRQPSNTLLWVDGGLGARLAKWLESVTGSDVSLRSATHPLRAQMDDVLARLVQVGVAEAHRVEQSLAQATK